MKYWQVVSWNETEHMQAVAESAETLGFEGLILAEHPIMLKHLQPAYPYSGDGVPPMTDDMEFPDPLITFAATAAVTRRLRFMTGVYLLGLRHPLTVAKQIATLARLSNNRFSLGIGSGWMREEHELLGVDFDTRGRRLNESIDIVRKLWEGEAVSHDGDFFQFPATQIRPFPTRQVPIIGGGTSAPALRRSALRCDGWYGPGNQLEELPQHLESLKQMRAQAELPWEGFEITAPLNGPLTPQTAERLAEIGVHGTVNYPFIFGCGVGASIEQKQDYMAAFVEGLKSAA